MGFLNHMYHLKASQICWPLLIVSSLSLVNQWHSEAAGWDPDMVAIFYHGSPDARDFLVQQDFFYPDQFRPKVYALKLKRQHIKKDGTKHYYSALFCRSCGLIIIYFYFVDSLSSNHKISSR